MAVKTNWRSLTEIEEKVCDLASYQSGIDRERVRSDSRLIQDLHLDSLDAVELVMAIEDAFDVALPDHPPHLAYKQVFTRNPFRLRDLAELVYLQQGSGRVNQPKWLVNKAPLPARKVVPFLQLGGRASREQYASGPLYSPIGKNDEGFEVFRRATDGMPCVLVPAAEVTIGSERGGPDERPVHRVSVDPFLIDQDLVSATAYCRFLNSIGRIDRALIEKWFSLTPDDKRREHELLQCRDGIWSPARGAEKYPMILVSWYGAVAYARWANRENWLIDDDQAETFLPSESQWEYAARGPQPREFPWGDEEPTPQRMRFGQHRRGATYTVETLPLADANEALGVSPFGLVHMAGNVWQWCRDWYHAGGYESIEGESGVRSERGGSWIGPAFLCRSSYRRGRAPEAKGRCLGFRCIGSAAEC